MCKTLIIADDLTGATDAGIQFAKKGLKTEVIFDCKDLTEESKKSEAIVIETNSRSISKTESYDRVTKIAKCIRSNQFHTIYKKIDSSLRGNIGQEIDAILDELHYKAAFIVPSFPSNGRTTINGIHFLNNIPINQTEMAKDPVTPISTASILEILKEQSKRKCQLVNLTQIRGDFNECSSIILNAINNRVELFIFDAETDNDLIRVAELISNFKFKVLTVGSAGLAKFLYHNRNEQITKIKINNPTNPVILVSGSASEKTHHQLTEVSKLDYVESIVIDPLLLLKSPQENAMEKSRCISLINLSLNAGKSVSFQMNSTHAHIQTCQDLARGLGLDNTATSNFIMKNMGEIITQVLAFHKINGLILTGGDTAKAICSAMEINSIELLDEFEPGIPIGRLHGERVFYAITKAGSFGNLYSLVNAMNYLTGRRNLK
ncbi:four-carbon acid sugar kinase family protein [Neobacillus sp. Marseille-QA0830]